MNKMIDLENAPWRVILFLIGVSMICFAGSIGLMGCKHPDMPPVDVTFWAGDSAHEGVTRKQEGKTIKASDEAFDDLACLSYLDVRKIYDVLLSCKDWGDQPKMSSQEMKRFQKYNREVIGNVPPRND